MDSKIEDSAVLPTTTTIHVSGLRKPLTVLHITDAHVSVVDPAEAQYHAYSTRMDNAYRDHDPAAHFTELMARAVDRRVDLIVLTGDIVNNPSKSSVAFVHEAIQSTGIRSVYIAGNHDWHYEGIAGIARRLARDLAAGASPAAVRWGQSAVSRGPMWGRELRRDR